MQRQKIYLERRKLLYYTVISWPGSLNADPLAQLAASSRPYTTSTRSHTFKSSTAYNQLLAKLFDCVLTASTASLSFPCAKGLPSKSFVSSRTDTSAHR
jgi:hypothetical protein